MTQDVETERTESCKHLPNDPALSSLHEHNNFHWLYVSQTRSFLASVLKIEDSFPVGMEEDVFIINVMYRQYVNLH